MSLMPTDSYHPWLHRMAVVTASLALVPIVVGAAVTTLGAGMAFLDWPSSDGHNMLLYPWLRDIAAGRTDKVVEHGHRLAGMLIGCVSIALAATAWRCEPRRWARWAATAVLLAVIAQGLLGGARVIQNKHTLAMVHGGFAALVFSLMASVALITSRSWFDAAGPFAGSAGVPPAQRAAETAALPGSRLDGLKPLALLTPLALFGQYLLGGFVRHLGTMLHEHLGFAVVALVLVVANAIVSYRTGIPWLRRSGLALLVVVLAQVGLGVGAWVTRFGFAATGYVAVQHSLPQVLFRTGHAVVGMVLLMVSVVHALRVFRLAALRQGPQWSAAVPQSMTAAPLGGHAG